MNLDEIVALRLVETWVTRSRRRSGARRRKSRTTADMARWRLAQLHNTRLGAMVVVVATLLFAALHYWPPVLR